jgi:hypothetical protein
MGTYSDRKRLRLATFSSDSEDEKKHYFDKFYIIESLEQGKTFSNVSPFEIEKSIKSEVGNVNTVKKLRDGKLLVEILRQKQGINLQKIDSFCKIKCQVSPHKTLNTSKGVIRDRRLFCASEDEMKNELASQGVTHVRRIQVKRNGAMQNTNTFILTFNNPTRPEKLNIFYELIPVSPYIPNPLLCFEKHEFFKPSS